MDGLQQMSSEQQVTQEDEKRLTEDRKNDITILETYKKNTEEFVQLQSELKNM